MEGYLLKFQTDVQTILNFQEENTVDDDQLQTAFRTVFSSLDLEISAYELSVVRDNLNEKLRNEGIGE